MQVRARSAAALIAAALVAGGPVRAFQAESGTVRARHDLPASETLHYRVEWRLITAGKAQLSWSGGADGDGGWRAKLHLESTGLVSKLFKVNDDYSSVLQSDLCAVSSHMISHEGRRHRESRVTFDVESGKASFVEKDLAKDVVLNTKEIDIPSCVHDVVGGLYYLRTLRLEPGQTAQIPVSNGKKSVSARVEAQQREVVKTPAGSFQPIRYAAFLFYDVLFRRSARLYVWITDDDRRLPVQIRVRMQFTIGTITFQLDQPDKEEKSAAESASTNRPSRASS